MSDWPETIPMPGPDEIIRNDYVRTDGKCCLIGWANNAFRGFPLSSLREFRSALLEEVKKISPVSQTVEGFNDCRSKPSERAMAWKRTAARFGYVVENKPWRAKR